MDTVALVDELIEDGQKLLDRLGEENFPVRAACWVKPTEEDRWVLYIATPELDKVGPLAAYRDVNRVLRTVREPGISVAVVKLIGDRHPITKDLLDILDRPLARTPIHLRRPLLGGLSVDEPVYVYPPPGPRLKGFADIKERYPSAELFAITIAGFQDHSVSNIGTVLNQFQPFAGKVNAGEFEDKAPETLLYMGPQWSSNEPLAKLMFVHRPEGWNTERRVGTESWERVVLATGKPLYEPVDFSPLAAMVVRQGQGAGT